MQVSPEFLYEPTLFLDEIRFIFYTAPKNRWLMGSACAMRESVRVTL